MFYDLNELSAHLPGIEKHRPNKSAKKIGFGRNVTLFDELGKWSFKEIRKFYGGRINGWNNWLSACINQGLRMNADLFGMNTLDYKEVLRIAKSVAKWSWHKMSPTGFSEWQSAQGKKGAIASAKVRSAASEDKRASARLMRTNKMSFRTIAKELDVSIGSAHAWCA